VVNRGPSLASCSTAIAAAAFAEAVARGQRDEAAQGSRELGVPRSDAAPPEHRADDAP
jgi:hypothetical protein